MLENSSQSKTIDLLHWQIHQENDTGECLDFKFSCQYILKGKHSLKVIELYISSNRKITSYRF